MITVGATLSYLLKSVMILALCFLWVAALLDIRSQMHRGVSSHKLLMFIAIAIAISVLAVCLIVATDALFIDNRGEPLSPWSDWGVRLGS
jgi:hypothetical protein